MNIKEIERNDKEFAYKGMGGAAEMRINILYSWISQLLAHITQLEQENERLREVEKAANKFIDTPTEAYCHKDDCNEFNYFLGDKAVCTCGFRELKDTLSSPSEGRIKESK